MLDEPNRRLLPVAPAPTRRFESVPDPVYRTGLNRPEAARFQPVAVKFSRPLYPTPRTLPPAHPRSFWRENRSQLEVKVPWKAKVCADRRERREVLFSLDVAGRRGVGKGKRKRQNLLSQVHCRR